MGVLDPRLWLGVLDTTLFDKGCQFQVIFSGYSGFLQQGFTLNP